MFQQGVDGPAISTGKHKKGRLKWKRQNLNQYKLNLICLGKIPCNGSAEESASSSEEMCFFDVGPSLRFHVKSCILLLMSMILTACVNWLCLNSSGIHFLFIFVNKRQPLKVAEFANDFVLERDVLEQIFLWCTAISSKDEGGRVCDL